MAGAMPELIFVAGPQQGERAVIMTSTAILGRSPTADVRLVEEAASREHVRFQFTRDGWVMENMSANGTLINGKRYKKNKKIVLDTGDVMGVGLETKMLYVAPGDDPEDALQDWREANPAFQPKPAKAPTAPTAPKSAKVPPPSAPSKPSSPSGKPPTLPPAGEKPALKAEDQAGEESEEEGLGGPEAKGSKTLKIVLLSVVLLGMVGFGFALIMRSHSEDVPGSFTSEIPYLTPEEISEALAAPLSRPRSPTQASAALKAAVSSYTNKALWEKGDHYRCVKQFKLYRAFSHSSSFPKIQYERMADAAASKFDILIRRKYRAAWKFEKAKNYRNAKQTFEELEQLLPVRDVERESQVYKVIVNNIRKHRSYVKSKMGKKP